MCKRRAVKLVCGLYLLGYCSNAAVQHDRWVRDLIHSFLGVNCLSKRCPGLVALLEMQKGGHSRVNARCELSRDTHTHTHKQNRHMATELKWDECKQIISKQLKVFEPNNSHSYSNFVHNGSWITLLAHDERGCLNSATYPPNISNQSGLVTFGSLLNHITLTETSVQKLAQMWLLSGFEPSNWLF